MLLCFDVGNTHITSAFINKTTYEVDFEIRIATRKEITEDELFSVLLSSCDFREVDIERVKGIIVSSVVSELDQIFAFLGEKYFSLKPFFVHADNVLPFSFGVVNKYETGADRLSNMAGAVSLFPKNNICVIDLGTATTFEIVKDGIFTGGFIIPGISMQSRSLAVNTSKLPNIKITKSEKTIGKTTFENINKGIYYGYIGQLKELITIAMKEAPDALVVATGGLATVVKDEIKIDHYIPELCFEGMAKIYELNNKK